LKKTSDAISFEMHAHRKLKTYEDELPNKENLHFNIKRILNKLLFSFDQSR